MKSIFTYTAIAVPTVLAVSSCLSLGTAPSLAEPKAEYDQYTLQSGIERSASGCRFEFRVYEPDSPISQSTVLLGHGFLRNQDRLIGLSRSLANAGIRTVTLDFCNMRPWNGNHRKNADDMRQLATTLNRREDIIYGGFSAGALAAVLAADASTQAVFILDFVDQANLGQQALQSMNIPLIGMHGPPSGCNANNAGLGTIKQYIELGPHNKGSYQSVANASHCEFESPSNWLCETACADDDADEDNDRTRQQIIDQSVKQIQLLLKPSS